MTVFEALKERLTLDVMAEMTVKLVNINNHRLYYMTSSGQCYDYDKYQQALAHEIQWLSQELPDTNKPSNTETVVEEDDPTNGLSPEE